MIPIRETSFRETLPEGVGGAKCEESSLDHLPDAQGAHKIFFLVALPTRSAVLCLIPLVGNLKLSLQWTRVYNLRSVVLCSLRSCF